MIVRNHLKTVTYLKAVTYLRAVIPSAARNLRISLAAAPLLALTTLLTQPPARAQGCAQCLDSTRATPPAVQSAYRRAIIMLGTAGTTLFIAGTVLIRRRR